VGGRGAGPTLPAGQRRQAPLPLTVSHPLPWALPGPQIPPDTDSLLVALPLLLLLLLLLLPPPHLAGGPGDRRRNRRSFGTPAPAPEVLPLRPLLTAGCTAGLPLGGPRTHRMRSGRIFWGSGLTRAPGTGGTCSAPWRHSAAPLWCSELAATEASVRDAALSKGTPRALPGTEGGAPVPAGRGGILGRGFWGVGGTGAAGGQAPLGGNWQRQLATEAPLGGTSPAVPWEPAVEWCSPPGKGTCCGRGAALGMPGAGEVRGR